ncbi:hypothetical protein R5W23_005477 [Gemmata sp. JC673]|uniref:Uncharacterized protein n=1 Tax=Gemmata algarum TaxID=2975278 RepID=A0ABU5ET06_9BACT|nr:hypothetical protein [Gemmata algarum]MDY3558384.1 hypothetical protein [Gemmata algarum]
MTALPADILAALPRDAGPAVERWWSGLSVADREEVTAAWDERREVCFFSPQTDAAGRPDRWEQVPSVVGGRFVPHDDTVRMHEWLDDWAEYVEGHEEVFLLPRAVVVFRTFHICRSEPAARAVAASGLLPAGFACPGAASGCPMQRVQAVAPGRRLHLAPAASGGWWVVGSWKAEPRRRT